jgi:threonyl-tRNA synthetase
MEKLQIGTIRHSLSHILAYAVQELYPGTKFGIGPAIENGFYYDFKLPQAITLEDLPRIEKKMQELIKKGFEFEKRDISKKDAEKIFKDQSYKLELIAELPENGITVYKSGDFTDLCAGPHVKSTKELTIDGFKLEKTSGAYWKGSEKNAMLTRIYGLAFESKKELDDYIKSQEEAAKRDHRILGEKLDLFMVDEKIGKGLPLLLPKGYFIRRMLEDYMYRAEREEGYQHVLTPILAKEDLYKTSGHLAHYKEDMYAPIEVEGEKYYLRPMNCPHHHSIYNHTTRSYKDLPLRIAEFGNVYRFERSGVLSGLVRVRGFTQNDSHIYATQDDLESEIINIINLFTKVYKDFDISGYSFRLSLPDFKNKGKYGDVENKEMWERGVIALKNVMKKLKLQYTEAVGEASFYGPKIDIQIKDVFGKEDTIATIQVDYYSASKFNLNYIDKDGSKKPVVVIHRAILGSFDRFLAFLIEKTAGNFPLWLAPVQIRIIPISDKHIEYAQKVQKELADFRVEVDAESETMGKKIRNGELQKIPYLIVVGDKEIAASAVAIRQRGKKEITIMELNKFIEKVKEELDSKK